MVNTSPEPVSNVVVSGAEDVATAGLLWLAYEYPYAAGALAAAALFLAGRWLCVPETACLPLAFAGLLLALALDEGPLARLLGSRGPRWLGDVSYATYLVHVPLLVLLKLLFVGPDLQLSWMDLAIYLAALLALSAALYRWLEKPAQNWLRQHPQFLASRTGSAA